MYQNEYDERMAHEAEDGAQAQAEALIQELDHGYSQELWTQKDGTKIKVADMEYKHIENTRRMLSDKVTQMQKWMQLFGMELHSRNAGKDLTKIYNQVTHADVNVDTGDFYKE